MSMRHYLRDDGHDDNERLPSGWWILPGLLLVLLLVLLLALVFIAARANAQEPRTATITFQRPTQYTVT